MRIQTARDVVRAGVTVCKLEESRAKVLIHLKNLYNKHEILLRKANVSWDAFFNNVNRLAR